MDIERRRRSETGWEVISEDGDGSSSGMLSRLSLSDTVVVPLTTQEDDKSVSCLSRQTEQVNNNYNRDSHSGDDTNYPHLRQTQPLPPVLPAATTDNIMSNSAGGDGASDHNDGEQVERQLQLFTMVEAQEAFDQQEKSAVSAAPSPSHGNMLPSEGDREALSEAFFGLESLLEEVSFERDDCRANVSQVLAQLANLAKLLLLSSFKTNNAKFQFLSCSADDTEQSLLESLERVCTVNSVQLESLIGVFSCPETVNAVQAFLASAAVRDLVVDICKNEVSDFISLKSILRSHIGYLFPELGKALQGEPQLLVLLPTFLKFLLSLLSDDSKSEKTAVIKSPVHDHVQCDGCLGDTSYKAVSIKQGFNLNNNIVGVRFKSAVVDDFDLCEACEKTGNFDSNYGPFLAIKSPAQAPKEIICVLNNIAPKTGLQSSINEVSLPPSGHISSIVHPSPAEDGTCELTCPRRNHPLKAFVVPNDLYACNVCDVRPKKNSNMLGCRKCDWDICLPCAEKNNMVFNFKDNTRGIRADNNHPVLIQKKSIKYEMNLSSESKRSTNISTSTKEIIQKTWKVKNSSEYQTWAVGTRIKWLHGEPFGLPQEGCLVCPLPPQATGVLSLSLRAPAVPGYYTGVFGLVTSEGNAEGLNLAFGEDLIVNMTVRAPLATQDDKNEETAWYNELKILAEMGFKDRSRNMRLLHKLKGDVARVVLKQI